MVLWVLSEEGREERGEGRRSEKGRKRMEWERGERRKGRKRGGEREGGREGEREEERRREKGRGKGGGKGGREEEGKRRGKGGREEERKGKGKGRKRGGGKREGEREEERRKEKGRGKGRGEGRKKQVKGIFTMNVNATDRHRHGSLRTETLHWYQCSPVSPVLMLELGLTTLPTVLTTVMKIS